MSRRRHRSLSSADRELWDLVRKTARPLVDAPSEEEAPPIEAVAPPKPPKAPPPVVPPVAAKPPAPRAAPLPARLDQKTRSRLSRGMAEIDALIDLHGMTQAVAHRRLLRFLEDAQANGHRLVLVITGKGSTTDSGAFERGVLRRSVPDWLQSREFRSLVVGYDEAGRRHGGGGALYVRVRRKREPAAIL